MINFKMIVFGKKHFQLRTTKTIFMIYKDMFGHNGRQSDNVVTATTPQKLSGIGIHKAKTEKLIVGTNTPGKNELNKGHPNLRCSN